MAEQKHWAVNRCKGFSDTVATSPKTERASLKGLLLMPEFEYPWAPHYSKLLPIYGQELNYSC